VTRLARELRLVHNATAGRLSFRAERGIAILPSEGSALYRDDEDPSRDGSG